MTSSTALEAQGIEVEQAINEYGPGQQEIAVRYRDALGAADQQVKFRDTVRGVTEVQPRTHRLLRAKALRRWCRAPGAHIHFSLWSPDGSRNLMYDGRRGRPAAVGRRPVVRGRSPAAPAGPGRTHLSQLQLVRASRARCVGQLDGLLGPRQPGGVRAGRVRVPGPRGGVDQRRAEGVRPELQPVPGARRPHHRRPRRGPTAARAAGAGAPRPGHSAPRRAGSATASGRCRGSLREALRDLQADAVLFPALGDLLGRCIIAVRTSEADALEQLSPDDARLAHLRVF